MFVNGRSQFTPTSLPSPSPMGNPELVRKILIGAGAALLVGGVTLWLVMRPAKTKTPVVQRPTDQATPLPKGFLGLDVADPNKNNPVPLKAEDIFFGDFYKAYTDKVVLKPRDISLPLNVKSSVDNYFEFTRQIALNDSQLQELGNKGYVVIDNPFARTSNSFLPVYRELNNRKLAFLLTSDFLFYYTQNSLKQIYKNVENDFFYQTFWENNLALFQQADKSYRDRYSKVGVVNDPILEGLRLEAVYFAMNLELLRPKLGQILPPSKDTINVANVDNNRFTQLEAQQYQFKVPDYLAQTVTAEIALISLYGKRGATSTSPVTRYTRDYTVFKVPQEYAGNAKLNNFFLASVWSRTEFPLYYKDKDCPSCLLDKPDWLVNQTAAHLIARDMSANQELKNKWAKVYKAIAYFNNLSNELSYLDYDRSFKQLFPQRSVEEVFDVSNPTREQDLLSLRNLVGGNAYDPAKGGLDRQTDAGRSASGLRVLQETYDPAKFIYDRLTYKAVGLFKDYQPRKTYPNLNTMCEIGIHIPVRCRAIGLDIINPLFDESITSQYFTINTNYENYTNQVPYLRDHFIKFGTREWHDNVYWSTLDTGRKYLNTRKIEAFPYTTAPTWADQSLTTVLAAATNSYLPLDEWTPTFQQTGLVGAQNIVKDHYVEPNLVLISELKSNVDMLFQTFIKLGLVKVNNNEFVNLTDDLEKLRQLVLVEQAGKEFANQDWLFMNELVSKYTLKSERPKTWRISFANPETKRAATLEQSMQGVKLLIELQHQQARTIMVVGPVFIFNERKY